MISNHVSGWDLDIVRKKKHKKVPRVRVRVSVRTRVRARACRRAARNPALRKTLRLASHLPGRQGRACVLLLYGVRAETGNTSLTRVQCCDRRDRSSHTGQQNAHLA
jgi:hypothetical protein